MDRALVIVRDDGLLAFKLGKRNEWNDPAAVDVGSGDCQRPIGGLSLNDFQNTLSAWRPDRNDHDPAGLQLLQQRGRNMVDAAGNNDLVKRRRLFPTIIAVGSLGLDCLKLLITILDELVVDRPRAVGQGLDDLYGVDLVGQMREVG